MAKRISVVLSQGQTHNPVRRQLEEDIITALIMEAGIDVTVVPNLYDLHPDHTGLLALQGITGDFVVVSWLYERATRWTLDRNGIRGQVGMVLLKNLEEEDDEDEEEEPDESNGQDKGGNGKLRVIDTRDLPRRKIYCLDLRASNQAAAFVNEIKRIAREANTQVVTLGGLESAPAAPPRSTPPASQTVSAAALARLENPANNTALGLNGQLMVPETPHVVDTELDVRPGELTRVDQTPERRWYPVIDFSRCTNCMECIDFCLFGVYGIDGQDTILVEQPDNCRKGCPACSRVCPENAIIFPQHKSPAIAGSPATAGALKIDLSRLFGAPDAVEVAARERDEQLLLAGRDAVGMSVGIPKRQHGKSDQNKDELDSLIDALDELDL